MNKESKQKEEQQNELHKTIWDIANDLRGSTGSWEFKAYILGMIFYRYISEKITKFVNKNQAEVHRQNFNYADINDKAAEKIKTVLENQLGFFIYPSQLFENVRKNGVNDQELTKTVYNIFNSIENTSKGKASEKNFEGLFSDFNISDTSLGSTVQEKNARLLKVMNAIGNMNIGDINSHAIDTFGDAYEFLMKMYASNAGKSGGEYFTPQEVSKLLMKICLRDQTHVNNIYDPTCGSGSLLLQAAKLLNGVNKIENFYGQEKNITTYNLCRINMFLHDVGFEQFNIACGDTLTNPKFLDQIAHKCQIVVSNPPYSVKWDGDKNASLVQDERFKAAGVLAPKSKADLAFILHALYCLAPNGTAAIVCFPGVLYRGGAEAKIRKYLIDQNKVDCVIALPNNLFFGTSISTSIMVLKNQKDDEKVLFIDASKEFEKNTNNNKLTDQNINTIYDWYINRQNVKNHVSLIKNSEIAKNNYTLSPNNYIEPENTKEEIDIVALNKEIKERSEHINQLRKEIDELIEKLDKGEF